MEPSEIWSEICEISGISFKNYLISKLYTNIAVHFCIDNNSTFKSYSQYCLEKEFMFKKIGAYIITQNWEIGPRLPVPRRN